MTLQTEVFIRRNKLRRQFETAFRDINSTNKIACKQAGVNWFHLKYSQHLLDRAIQREIDENYVLELFHKMKDHVKEIAEFLAMPERPEVEDQILPGVEYRPLRLEVTDGNLWLGFTVSKPNPDSNFTSHSMQCRMAIVNNKRLQGKISTKVINL